jgi:hypothetical protein
MICYPGIKWLLSLSLKDFKAFYPTNTEAARLKLISLEAAGINRLPADAPKPSAKGLSTIRNRGSVIEFDFEE